MGWGAQGEGGASIPSVLTPKFISMLKAPRQGGPVDGTFYH
jgi:hypothetical protein